jgi:hypothetical protein
MGMQLVPRGCALRSWRGGTAGDLLTWRGRLARLFRTRRAHVRHRHVRFLLIVQRALVIDDAKVQGRTEGP